jgi:hypothetical protein
MCDQWMMYLKGCLKKMENVAYVFEMMRDGNKKVIMKYEDYPKYSKMYENLSEDEKNSIKQKVFDKKPKRQVRGSRPLSATS